MKFTFERLGRPANFGRIAAAVAAPASTATGMVLLIALLVTTMSLTAFAPRWTFFLGGILAAAAAASISRAANSGWIVARRTAQLSAAREKLLAESRRRSRAEESLRRLANSVELVDRALPAILAYVDTDERVRYHNHAYTRWCGVQDNLIDGHRVADIIGSAAYRDVQPRLAEAMSGRDVSYERVQLMRDGRICRLQVQYLPHFGASGKVAGTFAILTDVTRSADVASPATDTDADIRDRLSRALNEGEFELYCQPISALGHPDSVRLQEVLVRSKEEERNHLAPGTFFPAAEEAGMLQEIDRWVVDRVIKFAAESPQRNVYLLRLAPATLMEPRFAGYVRSRLDSHGLGGEVLCFELPEAEVIAAPSDYQKLIATLAEAGCRFAVSGFDCHTEYLRLFEKLGVEFVKLDGSMVLKMLGNPEAQARIGAINAAAHAAGIRTVADCVEDAGTRAALRGLDTDFAQGFAIGKAQLMGTPADVAELTAS